MPPLPPKLTDSLDDFVKRPADHVRDLKRSGKPRLLRVTNRMGVVVQEAGAYQRLLDQLDEAEAAAGIRRGLADFEAGRFLTASEAVASIGTRRRAARRRAS